MSWLSRAAVVLFGVLVLQDAALRGLRVEGVRPDLFLGVAVVAGAALGPDRGAVVGFLAGLVGDLFLPAPLGLSALVGCLLAHLVGRLQTNLLPAGQRALPLTGFLFSVSGVVAYALLATVFGRPGMLGPRLPTIAFVVAGLNAVFAVPAFRALAWAGAGAGSDRIMAG